VRARALDHVTQGVSANWNAATATRNRSPEVNISPADAGTRTVVIPDDETGRHSRTGDLSNALCAA
jgi:hypothetical protein